MEVVYTVDYKYIHLNISQQYVAVKHTNHSCYTLYYLKE
jgi:hypothetical protein